MSAEEKTDETIPHPEHAQAEQLLKTAGQQPHLDPPPDLFKRTMSLCKQNDNSQDKKSPVIKL